MAQGIRTRGRIICEKVSKLREIRTESCRTNLVSIGGMLKKGVNVVSSLWRVQILNVCDTCSNFLRPIYVEIYCVSHAHAAESPHYGN